MHFNFHHWSQSEITGLHVSSWIFKLEPHYFNHRKCMVHKDVFQWKWLRATRIYNDLVVTFQLLPILALAGTPTSAKPASLECGFTTCTEVDHYYHQPLSYVNQCISTDIAALQFYNLLLKNINGYILYTITSGCGWFCSIPWQLLVPAKREG